MRSFIICLLWLFLNLFLFLFNLTFFFCKKKTILFLLKIFKVLQKPNFLKFVFLLFFNKQKILIYKKYQKNVKFF